MTTLIERVRLAINRDKHSTHQQKRSNRQVANILANSVEAVQTYVDNQAPGSNYLISGSAAWDTGLTFQVTQCVYVIDGITHISAPASITMDAADATHSRIDVFTVDRDGLVAITKGTPATPPVKPEYDGDNEVEITFSTVAAAQTVPDGVTDTVIYDEDDDWTSAVGASNVAAAATTDPYAGTKHIAFTAAGIDDYITLTAGAPVAPSAVDLFKFYVKDPLAGQGRPRGKNRNRFALFNGTTRVSDWVTLNSGRYGYDASTVGYQLCSIPMSVFNATGAFDVLKITASGTHTSYFDNIEYQEGLPPVGGGGTGGSTDGAVLVNGTAALTADWDAGSFEIRAQTLESDVATGTAPLTIASTTLVDNLNADTVDGVEAADLGQLAVAGDWTAQQSFVGTLLTALGSDVVANGTFTDGADIAVNGAFTGDTDWTKGTGWTIPATDAQSDGSQVGDSDLVNTGVVVEAGEKYYVTFTISAWTAGNCTAVVGAQEGTDRGSAATFSEVITATDTTPLTLRADADFIGTIDNVVIKKTGDDGWTVETGLEIYNDVLNSDGTQAGDADAEHTGQSTATVAAETYQVTMTVANYSAGNVTPVMGNQEGTDRAANGTFVEYIVASNTDNLKIRGDLDFVGDVDAVAVLVGSTDWDLDTAQVATITLDGNIVMNTPTNMVDGGTYILRIKQDGTGTRLITWSADYLWPGGTAPTLTTTLTTGYDVITFISAGSKMYGSASLDYS